MQREGHEEIYVVVCQRCGVVLRAAHWERDAQLWAEQEAIRAELGEFGAHGHPDLRVDVTLMER